MARHTPLVRDGWLHDPRRPNAPIAVSSDAWFAWLEAHDGFRFESASGSFTARKEQRGAGCYWYAARRQAGRLRRAYLGLSADLTPERLAMVAATLGAPPESDTHPASATPSLPPVLQTRLALPHLPVQPVRRERLLRRLDQALTRRLTLVSAPAGFGKTTLVADWLVQRQAQLGFPRVAWLALTGSDDDPRRFWRAVFSACQALDVELGPDLLALLHTPTPPWEALLTLFLNTLAGRNAPGILVLEDYHLLSEPTIHTTLSFVIKHLPASLHVIILTRSDPPLPLARLRAHHNLVELRAADLRFTPAEIEAFFQQSGFTGLDHAAIAQAAARTEGWAVGLRLLALALQGHDQQTAQRYLVAFSGSHRAVLDYLVTDVFSALPPHLKQFLLLTSGLERLCGPLCDAVLGIAAPESGGGAESDSYSRLILDELLRANLFLVPLDDAGHWYRYHALFAEALQHEARQQLGAAHLREVACRASRWYAAHALPVEAVEMALAADAFDDAAHLIAQIVAPGLVGNDYHTLRRWITRLPEAVLRRYPVLALRAAIATLFTSDRYAPQTAAGIYPLLALAEQGWQANSDTARLGEVYAVRALVLWFQWDLPQACAAARRALALLPPDNAEWRGICLLFVGLETLLDGHPVAAQQTLLEALTLCRASGNSYGVVDTLLLLGEAAVAQGTLRQAAAWYRQALDELGHTPMEAGQAQLRRGQALLGLATLELEWNALDAAEEQAREALAIGQELPDEQLLVDSTILVARIEHAHGAPEAARRRLHSLIAQTGRPLVRRAAEGWIAHLALRDGDLPTAQRWLAGLTVHDDVPPTQQEREALVAARLHLAQGDLAAARTLLDTWQADADAGGRGQSLLEIGVLQSLVLQAQGSAAAAQTRLLEVLAQAQREGYRRLFLDEGAALLDLLRTLLTAEDSAALRTALRHLLVAAQPGGPHAPDASAAGLIEPLSPQEQRVLRLLADGLSNAEIAQALVVSPNTVKTHLRNLYGKLGVSDRRAARAAARQLGLR
ncbi:MAG: LuxR family transcriptional regulator [Anaerolineae bacterium]|nr:MAG: LuxR family transcriptional regulator [Anaerolineae bacterium]